MNPDRLTTLIEAYALALREEIKLRPASWLRFAGDTAEDKIIRVACAAHDLIGRGQLAMIQTDSDAWRRTCAALRIPQTVEGIKEYLGRP